MLLRLAESHDVVSGIPRIIHQTYPTLALPTALQDNIDFIRQQNPEWLHRLYDDKAIERFIYSKYGCRFLDAYNSIDESYGAARADLFRYLVVYEEGGVYLDVKSRFYRPINEVLQADDCYVISQWRNRPGMQHQGWGLHEDLSEIDGGEFQQWHIIASKKHPFLQAVINLVMSNINQYSVRRTGVGWTGVLRTTGPIAYSRAIAPLLTQFPHRRLVHEGDIALEYSILERSSHQNLFARHYTQNTAPLIRKRGFSRLYDRLYLKLRALKRRL